MAKVVKAVDTKKLATLVNDFSKLYGIDLTLAEDQASKAKIEKKLILDLIAEANKYEGFASGTK